MPLKTGSVQRWMGPCAGTISFEHIIGVSVRATTPEKKMAAASWMANSRNRRPVLPVMKARGTKTAISVAVVAMTAKPISRAPSNEARRGGCPSSMRRCTFSISTMASSTTMPMASTMASSVSTLMEAPKKATTMKEARIDTGIATRATMLERQSRRKMRITRMTRATPSSSVLMTPLMEARMNRLSS